MNAYAFSGNGAGSSTDPYEITNCTQLQAVSNNLSASYELMNSIDCAAQTGFTPISGNSSFTGTFDGNNYTIDNLTVDPAGNPDNVSLFGQLDGATIRDFTLDHPHITGGNAVGSIAGTATNGTIISGIKLLDGLIQGTSQVGGFVGLLSDVSSILEFSGSKNTTVQGFSSTTTTSEIGGATGEGGGTTKYVSTEGSVIGNTYDNSMSENVGGISGSDAGITLSYSKASVIGGTNVGGASGSGGSFSYVYTTGTVTGDSYVGGLGGFMDPAWTRYSFSDSIVTGGSRTGAIFGDISADVLFVTTMFDTAYDSVHSTQPNCVGYDERADAPSDGPLDLAGLCIDVAGQPNYFFNNDSTEPFYDTQSDTPLWDFVNDWQVQANDYPLLRVQPSAPTNVSVTPGLISLTVNWDAPTDAQQAPITGYRLEYVKAGQTAMTVIPISDPTVHSYTITGLNVSTDYTLRLRAINQAGDGDVVNFASATDLTGPSAPTGSTASDSSSGLSVTTTQSPSTLLTSGTDTPSAQAANGGSAAVTDTSPKTPSKASDSLSNTTTQKGSTGSAWWWLSIVLIAAGAWFWRKHKALHP